MMKFILIFLFYFSAFGTTTYENLGIPDKPYDGVIHQEFEGPSLGGNFTLYNDSAAIPVNGTGGTECTGFTVAQTLTNPISGTGSLLITKPSQNCQGTGVAYTMSNLPGSTMATLDFDFLIPSGTYSSGSSSTDSDMEIWVYDATNSVMYQPAIYKIDGIVGTDNVIHYRTWFQTPPWSSGTAPTLRILLHSPNTTSATGFTFKIDKFYVRTLPSVQRSPIATDMAAFTPTISHSTQVGTVLGYKWRVADRGYYQVLIPFTGVTDNGSLTINMPSGEVIDTTKILKATNDNVNLHSHVVLADVSVSDYLGTITYNTTTAVTVRYVKDDAGGSSDSNNTANVDLDASAVPFASATGDFILAEWDVPIVGWGSQAYVSNDDGRNVIAQVTGNAASATSGNPIIFPTVTFDSHAGYSVSTGRYTVPVSGYYKMYGFMIGTAATKWYIYKNAVQGVLIGESNSDFKATVSGVVLANAGDILDIRPDGTNDLIASANLTFERKGGASFLSPTESVGALYTGAPTGTLNASYNVTTFPTKKNDSHSAYSSGTYTVPLSGRYSIAASVSVTGTVAVTNYISLSIYLNGAEYLTKQHFAGGASGEETEEVVANSVALVAGDLITLRTRSSITSPVFDTDAAESFFSIVRTGP